MSGPKVVLVVLVLIGVLFAVGVGAGVGARNPDGPVDPRDSALARTLGALFVRKQPLRPDEVQKCDCFDAGKGTFTLKASGPCTATVGPADTRLRGFTLCLKPDSKGKVAVHWKPNKGPEVRASLTPDNKLELQAPAEGGVLTLEANAPAGDTPPQVLLEK
jgi:hypothetical protein